MQTEGPPLNLCSYLRTRIINVHREGEALPSEKGARRWLAQGEAELQILEAELAAIGRHPPRYVRTRAATPGCPRHRGRYRDQQFQSHSAPSRWTVRAATNAVTMHRGRPSE